MKLAKKISLLLMTIIAITGISKTLFFQKVTAEDKTNGHISKHLKNIDANKVKWKEKDNSFWKKTLSSNVYYVTREEGTERPFTGKYNNFKNSGVFTCSNCGLDLFNSHQKFDSGTGWPSFWEVVDKKKVKLVTDRTLGIERTEVRCGRCDAHLGHVFKDGPKPTGLRYCINSVSLNFKEEKKSKK